MTWQAELPRAIGAQLASASQIPGGDIHDAFRVQLADGRVVFVKTHPDPPRGMFAAEAAGLDWLRTGPLRIPRVLAAGDRWLALEWLALSSASAGSARRSARAVRPAPR